MIIDEKPRMSNDGQPGTTDVWISIFDPFLTRAILTGDILNYNTVVLLIPDNGIIHRYFCLEIL